MEEDKAHRLYTLFARVNEGAKHKQGLGFGERKASPPRHSGAAPGGLLSSFVRSTTGFGAEQSTKPSSFAPLHDDSDDEVPAAKRLRQQRDSSAYQEEGRGGRPLPGTFGDRLAGHRSALPEGPSVRVDYSSSGRERELGGRDAASSGRGSHGAGIERSRPGRQDVGGWEDRRRGEREAGRAEKGAGSARSGGKPGGGKGPPDYASVIPGYEDMNPAEKLRARTRLALSQADARIRSNAAGAAAESDDAGGGGGGPWTRFVFNNDAHLDEEGGRPSLTSWEGDGAGGGPGGQEKRYNTHGLAEDLDVGELNALTFRRTADVERRQQALRRAEAQHEDAIFGSKLPPPPPLPPPSAAGVTGAKAPAAQPKGAEGGSRALDSSDRERRSRGGGGGEREQGDGRRRERDHDRDDRRRREEGEGRERRSGREERERTGGDRARERERGGESERRREDRSGRGGQHDRDSRGEGERDLDRGREGRRESEQRRVGAASGTSQQTDRERGRSPNGKEESRCRSSTNNGGHDSGRIQPAQTSTPSENGDYAGKASGPAATAAGAGAAAPVAAAPKPPGANVWRRNGDGDDDGPVVVDLDEAGVLAAQRAAAGLAADVGAVLERRAASPPLQQAPPQQLAETLSSAVLGQQGMSWRERALLARKKAAG